MGGLPRICLQLRPPHLLLLPATLLSLSERHSLTAGRGLARPLMHLLPEFLLCRLQPRLTLLQTPLSLVECCLPPSCHPRMGCQLCTAA